MKTVLSLCSLFVLVAFVSCNGTANIPQREQETVVIKDKIIPWEVVLQSATWQGENVSVSLDVTNKGQQPSDFPYDEMSILRSVNFVVVDSYGVTYFPEGFEDFYVEAIYPGETRNFKVTFDLNPRSGNISLYVTRYTGVQQILLFEIANPN